MGLDNYVYFAHTKNQVSFLPEKWAEILTFSNQDYKWEGCEKWWHSYPLICWFQLNQNQSGQGGKLFLIGEVGPLKNHEMRLNLINRIDGIKSPLLAFNSRAKNDGAKYSKFLQNSKTGFKGNSVAIDDVSSSDEIANAMKVLLDRFDEPFAQLTKILPEFVQDFPSKS